MAWWLLLPALLVAAGVVLPLVYLVLRAAQASWPQMLDLVLRYRHLELLSNTAMLAVGVLGLAGAIAFPLAWLVTRTHLPGRSLFTFLGVLPLAIPGYAMAYALLGAAGEQGLVASVLGWAPPRPTGYLGAVVALSLYTFPYLFLNIRSGLAGMDPALEEQARSLGHGPWAVFVRVTLPQLRPALQAGALLVALHALADFGVVSLTRYDTFSYAIYRLYTASHDRIYVAWLALLMLALTGALVLIEARLLKDLFFHRIGGGTSRTPERLRLGWWLVPAYGFLALVALVAVILPVTVIAYWMSAGGSARDWGDLLESLSHSLSASAPAAVLAVVLAYPLVYLSVRRPSVGSRVLERIAYFGYATPPIAFALAVIFFVLQGPSMTEAAAEWGRQSLPAPLGAMLSWLGQGHRGLSMTIYQSLPLVIVAFALHFLAEAIGPIRSALYQVPPRLEETARSLSSGPVRTFFRVTFPLIRGGLLVAMALVFLSAMKELPLTIILAGPGFETLAFNVWDKTGQALFAEAAPYALLLLAVSSLFVGVLLLHGRSRR